MGAEGDVIDEEDELDDNSGTESRERRKELIQIRGTNSDTSLNTDFSVSENSNGSSDWDAFEHADCEERKKCVVKF